MSADGKRAVVARVLNAANAPEVQNAPAEFSYELLFVDMISREVWTLVPQVDNLVGFDLSPNAQQVAFMASGLDGIPDATSNEPVGYQSVRHGNGRRQPSQFAPDSQLPNATAVAPNGTSKTIWLLLAITRRSGCTTLPPTNQKFCLRIVRLPQK